MCNLHWCYTWTALLSANQNRVIFFMYVITEVKAAGSKSQKRLHCFRVKIRRLTSGLCDIVLGFLFPVKYKALQNSGIFFAQFSLFSLSTKDVTIERLIYCSCFVKRNNTTIWFAISLSLDNRHTAVFLHAETWQGFDIVSLCINRYT